MEVLRLPTPFDVVLLCCRADEPFQPPLRHLCRVAQGAYVGLLPKELNEQILNAWSVSTPYVPGCGDIPIYAFLVQHGEPIAMETPLQEARRLMYLAALVKPTLVSARYCATVHTSGRVDSAGRWDDHYEHSYTVKGEPEWLRETDLDLFAALVAADGQARADNALRETRIGRAHSALAELPHTFNSNHRMVSAVSILEGLVAAEGEGSERVFEHRVPALARALHLPEFSSHDALETYNVRSRLAHSGGLDVIKGEPLGRRTWEVSRPTYERMLTLLDATEMLIRACVRQALLDVGFRALMEDDGARGAAFPVPPPIVARCRRCCGEEPRASVIRCEVCKRTWPDEDEHDRIRAELKERRKEAYMARKMREDPPDG